MFGEIGHLAHNHHAVILYVPHLFPKIFENLQIVEALVHNRPGTILATVLGNTPSRMSHSFQILRWSIKLIATVAVGCVCETVEVDFGNRTPICNAALRMLHHNNTWSDSGYAALQRSFFFLSNIPIWLCHCWTLRSEILFHCIRTFEELQYQRLSRLFIIISYIIRKCIQIH